MASITPLIVVVGPTASGKTSLAIELAQKYDGEVICADSRTVYKGMNIGTAKPTLEEQAGVSHWGLDIATPDQRYTAADFKHYANGKIKDVRARGKLPIIVGGTGLYVDSIIFDYKFPRPMISEDRAKFEGMKREALIEYCVKNNIELPMDDKNKRRLVSVINDSSKEGKRTYGLTRNTIVVGISTNKSSLADRIAMRTEQMFDNGVVEEATLLGEKYGWSAEAMTSNVYKIIRLHLLGDLSLEKTKELFTTRDLQLAKRQMTWFRRNQYIEWCQLTEGKRYIDRRLATEYNL